MNPFAPLYRRCNTGDPAAKHHGLAVFPIMLDVELTSACNFRCLMCPTGNLSLARDATFMTPDTFATILCQCTAGMGIRFIGWGEPLMHPDVISFISAVTNEGLLTHINTNGSKLDINMADRVMVAGLSSIKFSFQGIDRQSYREMRNIDFFDDLIGAIETMAHARRAAQRKRPWIAASTSITFETPEMVLAFRERLEPLVDELSIGNTIFDYMDLEKVRLSNSDHARLEMLRTHESGEKRHPDPCPEVYDKLSVHADGSVVLCCNDFDGVVTLGNVNETRLDELWMHPKIEAYRKRLARKDYNAPLCETCYDYMGCTVAA